MSAFENSFTTEAYAPIAVQSALTSKDTTNVGLALIRVIVAITNKDTNALDSTLSSPVLKKAVGYEACQRDTAFLVLAKWKNDKVLFQNYLLEWKKGQKKYPVNYVTDFLLWEGFKFWIRNTDISTHQIKDKKPRKKTPKLLQNPNEAVLKAIHENIQWLEKGCKKIDEIIVSRSYYFVEENKKLKEAIIHSNEDLPDIVIAFDEQGNYTGSFLMH
jgi:hypothetical protein